MGGPGFAVRNIRRPRALTLSPHLCVKCVHGFNEGFYVHYSCLTDSDIVHEESQYLNRTHRTRAHTIKRGTDQGMHIINVDNNNKGNFLFTENKLCLCMAWKNKCVVEIINKICAKPEIRHKVKKTVRNPR